MTDLSSRPKTSALVEIRRGIVNVAVPHHEPPSIVRRRRVVVAIVLVLGAAALSQALRRHPGEPSFYWLSLALAGAWLGHLRKLKLGRETAAALVRGLLQMLAVGVGGGHQAVRVVMYPHIRLDDPRQIMLQFL